MSQPPAWTEIFVGGTLEAEEIVVRRLTAEMLALQAANAGSAASAGSGRTMYAKTIAGFTNAVILVDRHVPAEFAVGHFQPGASLPVTLRFSNASGIPQMDGAPDMRGVSMRIALAAGAAHDLLLANFPTSFARNARQFIEFAMASIGNRETLLARLAARLGENESRRIAAYLKASLKLCSSLALERYWGGCTYLWGDQPVRYELRPVISGVAPDVDSRSVVDALRMDLAERLALGHVQFRLALQRYVSERRTPVEDAAVEWKKRSSPAMEIATVTIPQQDILGADGANSRRLVDRLAFDVWNAPTQFRPLGSLNRARRLIYEASAHVRKAKGGAH